MPLPLLTKLIYLNTTNCIKFALLPHPHDSSRLLDVVAVSLQSQSMNQHMLLATLMEDHTHHHTISTNTQLVTKVNDVCPV